MLQFRQYDGLNFQCYDENGVRADREFDHFVVALKERMAGPVIAPRPCMFFAEGPYGNGEQNYEEFINQWIINQWM